MDVLDAAGNPVTTSSTTSDGTYSAAGLAPSANGVHRLFRRDGREQIAGYGVLDCASLKEAVRWAAKHPHSWLGATEVRALAVRLPQPAAGKTRYMMLACTDPAVAPREVEPIGPWVADMDGRGVRLFGSELEPPDSARTVRGKDERAIVTDGPFAGTKEQITGFDVLECADLDQAVEVAARHPMARAGIVEVRPFRPLGED